jgi:hypothetical protein
MQPFLRLLDFTEYKYLTQNLDQEELETVIEEALEFDILPVIGAAFMLDITTKLEAEPVETIYDELLNGKTYTPTGATGAIHFKGLKQVLKYYVYARLMVQDGVKSTASGFVHKVLENSERVSSTQRTQMISQTRSGAAKFESDLIAFLCNFAAIYPLYCGGIRKNKGTGFRINAI